MAMTAAFQAACPGSNPGRRILMKKIAVFCAHPDDEVFGMGGTIAKYSSEGSKILIVIFSYGESSHPWMKPETTQETRKKESGRAAHLLGCRRLIFLGLKDGFLAKDVHEKGVDKVVQRIIKFWKPESIFTHSLDDPLPDHGAVYATVMKAAAGMDYKGNVFSFDIWNPVNIRTMKLPKLFVDISNTFDKKIKALEFFESQKITMFSLLWSVYVRAFVNGFRIRKRFAERFYKVR